MGGRTAPGEKGAVPMEGKIIPIYSIDSKILPGLFHPVRYRRMSCKIPVQQPLEDFAVPGFILAHFVYGIMDRVEILLLP